MWTSDQPAELNAASLAALFANEIPAIRVPAFATAQECESFAAATRPFTMKPVVGDTQTGQIAFAAQRIDHLGMTQAAYKTRGPEAYFAAARQAIAETDAVFARSFNPLDRLMTMLRAQHPSDVAIAVEPDGRRYFAGIIRKSNEGLALHADFAPYQAPDYMVDCVAAQLAWNFYAEVPPVGGVTTLHDALWTWNRSRTGEVAENYPLPMESVAGARTYAYQPKAGEAWFFNSRNPHRVSPPATSTADRLAVACFIGRLPDGRLTLWS
jgi:hypothetical protein